jgi:hypothetical protein
MTPSAQIAGGRRVTRWSRESVIEKIEQWSALHGEPPCSADWNPSLARWRAQEWRIERYREGQWPSTNAVKRHFGGSFDAAVRAAGFVPARPGPARAAGTARPAAEPRVTAPVRDPHGRRRLTPLERDHLRQHTGPVGPGVLADALRRLHAARSAGDRVALVRALEDVAAAAVNWRDRL